MNKSTSTLEILLRLRDEATSGIKGATKSLADMQARLEPAADASRRFAVGVGAVAAAAGGFGIMAVKAAADMESLRMGLDAVSGSSEESEKQLVRLKEVARLPGLGFQEAVQGSINLQAAGLSATTAERALQSFGNALATVGKGKAELSGVILALTQIASKGKVSAEEINQLNERIPQIRVAMKTAFGTADTEELAALGIDSQTFIDGIITEFEKLPPVMGGFNIAVENLQDTWNAFLAGEGAKVLQWATSFVVALEGVVSNVLPPLIQKIGEFTTFLGENKVYLAILTGAIVGALIPALLSAALAFGTVMLTLAPFIAFGAAIALVIYGLVTAFQYVKKEWGSITGGMKSVWESFTSGVSDLWEGTKQSIIGALTAVKEKFLEIIDSIREWAYEHEILVGMVVGGFASIVAAIFVSVIPAFIAFTVTLATTVAGAVMGFSSMILTQMIPALIAFAIKLVTETIPAIVRFAIAIVAEAVPAMVRFILSIGTTAIAAFVSFATAIWTTVLPAIAAFSLALMTNPIFVLIALGVAIGALVALIIMNWDKIKAVSAALWGGLKEVFKEGVNFLIGLAEGWANSWVKAVNTIIGALNKIKFSIPDWVPGVGGKSFAISIPTVPEMSIPKLATGGLVTRPTIAMVGEAGPEAVIPLNRLGSNFGGGNVSVYIQGDVYSSREAAIEMANEIARVLRYQVRI